MRLRLIGGGLGWGGWCGGLGGGVLGGTALVQLVWSVYARVRSMHFV